jgi:hypothetical protein
MRLGLTANLELFSRSEPQSFLGDQKQIATFSASLIRQPIYGGQTYGYEKTQLENSR